MDSVTEDRTLEIMPTAKEKHARLARESWLEELAERSKVDPISYEQGLTHIAIFRMKGEDRWLALDSVLFALLDRIEVLENA